MRNAEKGDMKEKEYLHALEEWIHINQDCSAVDGWTCIGLPIFYSDGDGVSIYVKENEEGYTLADDGETLSVHCVGQEAMVIKFLVDYGYEINNNEIMQRVRKENLGLSVWNMAQTIVMASYVKNV